MATWGTFGEMVVGERIGVGESQLDTELRVRAGRYRVLHAEQADDARVRVQLLCVHTERQLADIDVAGMREATRFEIEGARFTLADASLDDALHEMTGYYKYLEGVHGLLRSGNGVTLSLEHGGEAAVWVEAGDAPSAVLVEIRRESSQAEARLAAGSAQ